MDPQAAWAEALLIAYSIIRQHDSENEYISTDDAARLSELVVSIDNHVSNGGNLPQAFER